MLLYELHPLAKFIFILKKNKNKFYSPYKEENKWVKCINSVTEVSLEKHEVVRNCEQENLSKFCFSDFSFSVLVRALESSLAQISSF